MPILFHIWRHPTLKSQTIFKMPLIPYVITTSRTDLFILFDALLLYRYLKRPTSNYTGLNYF